MAVIQSKHLKTYFWVASLQLRNAAANPLLLLPGFTSLFLWPRPLLLPVGEGRFSEMPGRVVALLPSPASPHTGSRRCSLDVTRPQHFPGRRGGDDDWRQRPRATSDFYFALHMRLPPASQTHFLRDSLPITAHLRNPLQFQNLRKTSCDFQTLHFFPSQT